MIADINKHKQNKVNAAITGTFFIVAAVSSIIGKILYDPILGDGNALVSADMHYNQIIWGAICELILAVSATGTGVMLYTYLRKHNNSLGAAYLSFRLLEVVLILIGIVSVLTVLSISQSFNNNLIANKHEATLISTAFIALHDWTFILGPNFMLAVNTFIYSFVFRKTGLVPKGLSLLGLISACLIMIAAILEMFAIIEQISLQGVLLAIPIAVYEMSLAVQLIRKGFRTV